MRRSLVAVLCLSVALAGCKAKEAFDKVAISKDLDKRGTTALLKDVANDSYTEPADGKLTDGQIQMYLKVREQEKKIVQVAKQEAQQHADNAKKAGEKSLAGMMEGFKTLGSVADMMTADIRAAKDLGYNTQEYIWIKQQVLAVSGAEVSNKIVQGMATNMDQAYKEAKKAYDAATDEPTKQMYQQVLAGYEASRKEMEQQKQNEDPALAHNRQLLSKYENSLNALTAELAKWEDKPGDAQKWQQEVEKKTSQAGNNQ